MCTLCTEGVMWPRSRVRTHATTRAIAQPIDGATADRHGRAHNHLPIPSAHPLSFLARVRNNGRRAIAYRDLLPKAHEPCLPPPLAAFRPRSSGHPRLHTVAGSLSWAAKLPVRDLSRPCQPMGDGVRGLDEMRPSWKLRKGASEPGHACPFTGAVIVMLTLYGRLEVLRLNEAIARHCGMHIHILRRAGRRSPHRPSFRASTASTKGPCFL
ncbi:hypothetical protein C8Q74DRAFT_742163 [Fomes fomentarius]|nr:hypothetical protein C8Q74DRAFT_742163 [Fomes fomentarius]